MATTAVLLLVGIAVVCGALGQMLAGYSLGGFFVSTGIGFIGAVLGLWLANTLGLPEFYTVTIEGIDFPLVWSVLGSALLVAVLGVLAGGKKW